MASASSSRARGSAASNTTTTSTATAPKLYIAELGQNRCIQILRECFTNRHVVQDPITGCCLYRGKLTSDGHWQIQRRPKQQTRPSNRATDGNRHRAYYVHRIAYAALWGKDILETGSHLCGNANCFNPYHIWDESQLLNNDRQRCVPYICCPRSGVIILILCTHSPVCIKKPTPATHCCSAHGQQDHPAGAILPPAVQTIQDFFDTEQDVPDTDVGATESEAEDTDISMGGSTTEEAATDSGPGSQQQTVAIRDALLPDSSFGAPYETE
ncbi:hypothetical protein F5Y18DRAFT_413862 [Xylariaceae sp. FL1019]|nr:hypothetical protein F5Y18DRAFT_413862 [Xylariaceae sp. FL1019]